MCNKCYPNPCTCHTCHGDPLKLDFGSIIYNKYGLNASDMLDFELPNGSSLRLVIETLAQEIRNLKAPNGYLGTVTTDPSSAVNGNYWHNSTEDAVKIKINGIVKEISIV